ncbi:MAG: metallophosphoesterase [Clostridia bacterium]|nr:metallophosphoesterase [Clostridia bacterium]
MTYVMSDLHGQYDKYRRMLDKINLGSRDELFILGDVVDRGPEPMKILMDMSMRDNVFPIMGNHDYMALHILSKLQVEITDDNYNTQIDAELMRAMLDWQMDGGNETITDFRKLSADDREFILDYIADFSPYEELEIGGNRFLLVHGGVGEAPVSSAEEYDLSELLTARPDYSHRYFDDRWLVTGHTPTLTIDKAYDGRIYRANGHIAVDCGACFDRPLGCIRLEDFAEFYVE